MVPSRNRPRRHPLPLPWIAAGGVGLALLLAGCGSDKAEQQAADQAKAAPWPEARPAAGVRAQLEMPDTVPPQAALVSAKVTLTNTGSEPALLSIPTPCDRNDWRLLDAAGQPVMRKHPVDCVQQSVTFGIAAGESMSETITLDLEPGVLQSGHKYTLEYRFWG